MSDQPNLDATEQQRALSLELPPTQSEFSSLSTQEAEGGESQGKRTVEPHVVIESPSPNDKSIEGTRLKDSPTQDEFSSFNITQEVVDEESQQERIVEPQNVVENPSPTKRSIGGASFKSLGRMTSTVLNLRDLPDHVADNLRQFDINGDGMISMTELVHGALTRQEQEEKVILPSSKIQNQLLSFDQSIFFISGYLLSSHDYCFCADLDDDDGRFLRRGLRGHRGQ